MSGESIQKNTPASGIENVFAVLQEARRQVIIQFEVLHGHVLA
jgi:hypothetical protein